MSLSRFFESFVDEFHCVNVVLLGSRAVLIFSDFTICFFSAGSNSRLWARPRCQRENSKDAVTTGALRCHGPLKYKLLTAATQLAQILRSLINILMFLRSPTVKQKWFDGIQFVKKETNLKLAKQFRLICQLNFKFENVMLC